MMRILSQIVAALSASAAISLMVKGTAVVTLGLMSAWLARRGRAAVRHALLASAFGVLLALPVVSLIAPPVTIAVPVAASDSVIWPWFDYNLLSSPRRTASAHPGATPTESGWSLPSLAAVPLSTILFYGWLTGIALFVVPVIRGLLQVRSLRRFGLPWRHGQAVAERLAPRSRRGVGVRLNESLSGPMTCGVLRPVVILPEDAQNWDEKDLERALVHELEHVRRYDWAIHCLARVACAAYWFHPLVWAAWRQLTLEARRSCDDAVLGNSEATAYAEQLLGLARRRFAVRRSPALAMANRSDLAARIAALLDRRQARGPVSALLVAASAVAVAIVLTIAPFQMIAAPQSGTNSTFEVASVKPHVGGFDRDTLVPPTVLPSGRFVSRFPLKFLISYGYKVPFNQTARMTGIPGWAEEAIYDVEAKSAMPPGLSIQARNDRARAMVQALLVDRFKLVIRRESKEMPVYALLVAKGGPKLQRADIDEKDCPEASLNALGPVSTSTPFRMPATPLTVAWGEDSIRGRPVFRTSRPMSRIGRTALCWIKPALRDYIALKRKAGCRWTPVWAPDHPNSPTDPPCLRYSRSWV